MPTLQDMTTISSCTGHQISRMRLNLEFIPFFRKFEFALIQSSVSGAFFTRILSLTKFIFPLQS